MAISGRKNFFCGGGTTTVFNGISGILHIVLVVQHHHNMVGGSGTDHLDPDYTDLS